MQFGDLIVVMTQAIVRGDGAAAAACFTDDGVYHDAFYGPFPKGAIPELVHERFHRDATAFVWDIHDPVDDGRTGYARYVFSYDGRIKGSEGRRAMFEGVAICLLRDGLLERYTEVASTATGLVMLGFEPGRLHTIVQRQAAELAARDEALHHGAQRA